MTVPRLPPVERPYAHIYVACAVKPVQSGRKRPAPRGQVVPLKRPSATKPGSEPPSPEPFLSTPGADHPSETSVRVDGQELTGHGTHLAGWVYPRRSLQYKRANDQINIRAAI